jgi:hypothetical protein
MQEWLVSHSLIPSCVDLKKDTFSSVHQLVNASNRVKNEFEINVPPKSITYSNDREDEMLLD